MIYETAEDSVINFSHLGGAMDFFPFSCLNGYYFLWNSQLDAPKEARAEPKKKKHAESLLRREISSLKRKTRKA